MRKSFLKIASAATTIALALTIGVGNAVAAENEENINESSELVEECATVTIINDDYAVKFQEFFEEAMAEEAAYIEENFDEIMLREKSLSDPYIAARERAREKAQEECEKLGLYAIYTLSPMEGVPFIGWSGSFGVEDLTRTSISFNSPNSFRCSAGGVTASMTATSDFSANYKRASVSGTFDGGATSDITKYSNNAAFEAKATKKPGEVIDGRYSFYLYNGNGSGSGFYEAAIIHLYQE